MGSSRPLRYPSIRGDPAAAIGDEDIYTEVPNPEAGHEEEVIPPPAPEEEQGTTEPNGDR
jgi:hypothetical protein